MELLNANRSQIASRLQKWGYPGRNQRDKGLQIGNCKAAVISGLLNILPLTKCIGFRTGTYQNVYLASQTVTEIKKWQICPLIFFLFSFLLFFVSTTEIMSHFVSPLAAREDLVCSQVMSPTICFPVAAVRRCTSTQKKSILIKPFVSESLHRRCSL